MNNSNIIPFLIIILSITFIYGYLINIKNNKFNKSYEFFTGSQDGFPPIQSQFNQELEKDFIESSFPLDPFKNQYSKDQLNKIEKNAATNTIFTKKLADGSWTTQDTIIDKTTNIVSNLMDINISESNNSDIIGNVNLYNKIYNITFLLNENLFAKNSLDNRDTLNIKFINNLTDENNNFKNDTFDDINIPKCIVTILKGNSIISEFISYKLINDKIDVNDKLYRIILANDYYVRQPPILYNFEVYNKIVENYKYPENYIELLYKNNKILDKNIEYNKIKNNYNGQIKFSIRRVFQSPTGNAIITKMSNPILLDVIKNNQLPSLIKIKRFMDDKKVNNLQDFFIPNATLIYFYKLQNSKITYNYGDSKYINFSKNELSLQNNANNMFLPYILYNDLNKAQKIIKDTYKCIFFKKVYVNNYSDLEIKINFSDIYKFL
jgi:hypothetical protein